MRLKIRRIMILWSKFLIQADSPVNSKRYTVHPWIWLAQQVNQKTGGAWLHTPHGDWNKTPIKRQERISPWG
ncbi:unnamed protein product [Aspergillus oryzae var. brunneus]|uniref:Unnamed protein product n=2 Tax=Aspergillus oryzae TaxID=5062 RepID=A0AAN4YDY2_ASPOZ|nr:unnamed protein product [Aspergillus oryzae]GMG54125.1 unnamed protein product [Aspergillus oryzae var. brunneus]